MRRIYTRTGDEGTTSLSTKQRVPKDSLRVEAYGTVDEVNSALGLARALCKNQEVSNKILEIQQMLMRLMKELASIACDPLITSADVQILEETIDHFNAKLPPLQGFLLPGGCPGAGALDLSRTITRRAERQIWRLSRQEAVHRDLLVVLNRLSDLCFVLERAENCYINE